MLEPKCKCGGGIGANNIGKPPPLTF